MPALLRIVLASSAITFAAGAIADDAYYSLPIRDLKLTEGNLPTGLERPNWRFLERLWAMQPYAVLDGPGEVYVDREQGRFDRWSLPNVLEQGIVAIRTPRPRDVTGRLFFPKSDWSGMVIVKFVVPAAEAKDEARGAFYQAKQAHYEILLQRRTAGAAWFRHQAREARIALHSRPAGRRAQLFVARPATGRTSELSETFAIFSGGRAMSENLQLDRPLATPGNEVPDEPAANRNLPPPAVVPEVELDSITGITVREINWGPLLKDLKPKLDPLAAKIPADQHAVFFPTFNAAVTMADEVARQGMSILQLAEPRSESAQTFQHYQRQLCLSLDGASRLLGPQVARSMAVTGSDPYFRTGTDMAVLFEAPNPDLLQSMFWARIKLAAQENKQTESLSGTLDSLAYHGVRSPDRSICCYVAKLDGAVVVTNSLYQLQRLAGVSKERSESLASLPEYTFFRNRYRLGDPEETALVFLSDATIRRWCGPRWRIGTSRRIRDAAVMAEVQAARLDELVKGALEPGPIETDLPIVAAGQIAMTSTGVSSSAGGTLEFMTPIAELPISKVTKAEADAYRRWRQGYERNWTLSFDPIAVRLGVRQERLSADLTVMPLIVRSAYREAISVSRGAQIAPDSGDPHGALAHFVIALNPKFSEVWRTRDLVETLAKHASLGWLGSSVAIYADDDPFWQDLAKVPDDQRTEFLLKEAGRVPVAVRAEVSDGLKLAAFLTGLRAYVEETVPGLTKWETLEYNDQPYVKVSTTEKATKISKELEDLALYYVATGDSLVVTLSESLLKRALDRQIARRQAKDEGKPLAPAAEPWLGSNLCLQVDRKIIQVVTALGRQQYQAAMQARAWGNLPILNEWKRLYTEKDPVELHERFWQTRLICPGGGTYVWNEKWQTMESTVYGHPGQPKQGPAAPPELSGFLGANFGLTFEEQGLRARASLQRELP